MTVAAALLLAAIVTTASTVQTFAGFGFALVAVPLFMEAMGARDGVVIGSLLGTLNAVLVAIATSRHAHMRTVLRMLGAHVIGMPIGLLVLLFASGDVIRVIAGLTAIVSAVALARGAVIEEAGPRVEAGVGLLAGLLDTSTGMAGPPIVLYLQGRRLGPLDFRGTLSTFFCLSSVVTQSAYVLTGLLDGRRLGIALSLAPLLLVGNACGRWLHARVSPERFRGLVLALLVVSAASVAISALARLLLASR